MGGLGPLGTRQNPPSGAPEAHPVDPQTLREAAEGVNPQAWRTFATPEEEEEAACLPACLLITAVAGYLSQCSCSLFSANP